MSAFAAVNGVRVVSGNVSIPRFGMWSADVSLATTDPVTDGVTLTVGNLSLVGHVIRQAAFAGARACRIVAGAGGWRKVIGSKPYALASGVMLSLVLGDAAREVGEMVNIPTDRSVGAAFVRENAEAARVLRQLAGPSWYVDNQGVTQIQARPSTTVSSPFTVVNQDGGMGLVTIATEDYASWLPGASFSSPFIAGPYTVSGVRLQTDQDGTLRLEVLTS